MAWNYTPTEPRAPDREMIPKTLLRAMAGLAIASLVIVSYSVLTGRDHAGVPKPSEAIQSRTLILEGGGAKRVVVRDGEGQLLMDLPHGGFITVVQNGLAHERKKQGVDLLLPVTLTEYANGRLTIFDPSTGWSAELHGFGDDNKAAFERLLDH